jgi:CRISPR-associated protein (TIGR02710 family)
MENQPQAIISTVGLPETSGDGNLARLQLDLEKLKPNFIALISSEQSRPHAETILERCALPSGQFEITELSNAHDLDEVFRKTNRIIEGLIKKGYAPEKITINYTSGTKVMGSGVVLSAVYKRIMQLRYISAPDSANKSTNSSPPAGRIFTTKPGAVYAYQDLLRGRTMALDLRFRSAHALLEEIEEDMLTPVDRKLRAAMSGLTQAYEKWVNFDPHGFLECYAKVVMEHPSLAQFRLGSDSQKAVGAVAGEMKKGEPGPYLITDLFNNAARLMMLGANEDAMERLYRALEMLAQWVLRRDFKIDINDVDTRRIPPRDRVGYEALRSIEDGLVKIGLRKSYSLLIVLESPLGARFQSDPVMRQFLEQRGESILAHGLRPAQSEDCHRFMAHAAELFTIEMPDFEQRTRLLQFPWLTDR